MTFIFHINASQELYQSTDEVHNALDALLGMFPLSAFLKTQRALLHYHAKDFDEAEQIFSQLLTSDPHRIDSLDNYSNILYVMGMKPKLAFLGQVANNTDKFRPETCCVIGNYYSLKSEHEKAVMYFRRALTLDRNFLSAWTLMGHEFVEMKNTHAAIESYRRAVDVNRKDYRAWYGLGQTYEMLEMHSYARFYYDRAAALRPYDPKMWMALGQCYSRMGKTTNGIFAYKRALVAGSYYDGGGVGSSFGSGEGPALSGGILDPEVLYQLALLYERSQDLAECAKYMELVLAQEESQETDEFGDEVGNGVGVTPTTSKARLWLARWEYMRGMYQRAMELANELCQDGVEVEDAKALVRDIRARMDREG
jgi:anaphase-promoting complex subunit 8